MSNIGLRKSYDFCGVCMVRSPVVWWNSLQICKPVGDLNMVYTAGMVSASTLLALTQNMNNSNPEILAPSFMSVLDKI